MVVFKGMFPRFNSLSHCLSITVYTLKRDLEIQRDCVFHVQNVCDDIPGVGHLPSSFIPTPGNLPP